MVGPEIEKWEIGPHSAPPKSSQRFPIIKTYLKQGSPLYLNSIPTPSELLNYTHSLKPEVDGTVLG